MATLSLSTLQGIGYAPAAGQRSLAELLSDRQLFVASNRGPVHYRLRGGIPEARPAAGGLATALSSLANYAPLTWLATASGPGDRLVASRGDTGPAAPGSPSLSFVTPTDDELNWFYRRFSNPVLWFLQHGLWDMFRRPNLDEMTLQGWTLGYRPVNHSYALALERKLQGQRAPVVMVHDYHLYLVPGLLRRRVPEAKIHHFTHIPWPEPSEWERMPAAIRRAVCTGLLGADVVGFQTGSSALNFLSCCDEFVPPARVDFGRRIVRWEGREVMVRDYPISVDVAALRAVADSPEAEEAKSRLSPLLGQRTIVRVDRLDPSKNVALGFRAFGELLKRRPDLLGRVRFLAFLVPSRQNIAEYRRYSQEVFREAEEVNARFGGPGWQPVQIFHEDNRLQSMAAMMLADVLLVNPVADGMNLVAKEGAILSQRDAVLVLSDSCGAHEQLSEGAVTISPRDLEDTVAGLARALDMPVGERRRRARILRWAVESEDLSWWVRAQLEDLLGD